MKPEHFTEHEEAVMSNLFHEIDESVAKEIKGKDLFSQYAGWNFCGYVYWLNNKWNCDVWQYYSYRETVSAESLEKIMEKVCDKYGDD